LKLKILHTNDIHSRFENFAGIVTLIRQMRDENTIVLDAGDFNDFMRIELQGTDGRAGVELLDTAGYDAIAVGNNETFQGIDALRTMANCGKIPFLACNLFKYDFSDISGVKGSIILNRGGLRILVIGLSPVLHEFFKLFNMRTIDEAEAVKGEMERHRGEYDICILLSHLGLKRDIEVANKVEGIDIIIGGHSHDLMSEPEVVRNTVIHQSGSFGEYMGVLEIEYQDKILSYNGMNIKAGDAAPDTKIIESLRRNREIAIDNLCIPLYNIEKDLWHDVMEENPMTNLLADALRDTLKCDIGLINSGVLNGGIRKGPVSRKKLIEIGPSPLNPTYIEIQGKHIKSALEKSMYSDFCTQEGKGSGYRGRFLGKLHISGAVVEHDGRHVIRVLIGGREMVDDKWYTVATSDYLQRGTGYTDLASNRNERYNPEYLRETLKNYLCRQDFVEKAYRYRWIKID
jgi:5''-nucleotidase/2'',3''-cyclic phosphodiesterase and related esterases